MDQSRSYRDFDTDLGLVPFQVAVDETDLYIKARTRLETETREAILVCRADIEGYIRSHPAFDRSLTPLPPDASAPPVVQAMLRSASQAQVGPMAAVAGAIAEFVGRSLLNYSTEVIVENGGDLFVHTMTNLTVSVFAGSSPFSGRIGIRVPLAAMPMGICTSSGTVGPSLSFGKADAVTVLSPSAALADAAATAVGNVVKTSADIAWGLKIAGAISQVTGAVIIVQGKMGVWGEVELVSL